jgi:GntR family transcriptional regulator/MocR family aminotransferase
VPCGQLRLDFLCRILLDPGEEAWIEDPGFLGARNALRNAGAQVVPVPVDSKEWMWRRGSGAHPRPGWYM